MPWRSSSLAMLAGALLMLASAPVASGGEAPSARVVLILDASGSMWGQINGRHKIEIAREVIHQLLEDWDPSVHLGLTAYGHRREGDCADIESLIPADSVDPASVRAAVDGLNPKGKTPLSDAVIHAARQLRYQEEKATVILVSDGIETCDRDPCEVARALEEAGADFTTYVIGFDVTEETAKAQLRCLAENTGGEFTVARDARSLRAALQRAVQWARISLRAPEYVFSSSEFEVEWSGPDAPGDKIVIVPTGTSEGTLGTHAETSAGTPARLVGPITSGPHEVRYVSGLGNKTLLALEINVRGSEVSLEVPGSIAAGAELAVGWTGPNADGDRIVLVPSTEPDERYFLGRHQALTSAGSPAKLEVFSEPGNYEVRYLATHGARVLAREAITVTPAVISLDAPARVEAGAEFDLHWTGPDRRGDRIVLVQSSDTEGTYSTKADFTRASSGGSPLRLTAYSQPGDYEIRYMAGADGGTLASAALVITPSRARIEAPSRVAADHEFEVRWQGPASDGDRIVLIEESAPDGRYYTSSAFAPSTSKGSPLTLRALPDPGAYEIRYLAEGDGKTLARVKIEIVAD
ncbi:MAG: VWA domain-containing protein [Thermoanaerobaculia bacterium]